MVTLAVEDLTVHYEVEGGYIGAVDGVSFEVPNNTITGLAGESGCGKTTLALSLIRNLPENGDVVSGSIELNGEDILELSEREFRELRWKEISYIPQNTKGSLDPIYTFKEQMVETIQVHTDMSEEEAVERSKEVLEMVDIDPARLDDYPHQFSGGMIQRAVTAMAFLLEPSLIVADEPTTGLDVLVKDKVLQGLEQLQSDFDTSLIIVSHDMADLIETSDLLMVMYGGKLVEKGPSRELIANPTHPYTIGLKNSLPEVKKDPSEMISMDMNPPNLRSPPQGCRFVDKCPYDVSECHEEHPEFVTSESGLESACYRADEAADMREQALEVRWMHE